MERVRVPLRQRPVDFILLAFFVVNLCFITYIVDIEQVIIRDPAHFSYPVWPPRFFVDLVHSYGSAHDPLLMARPPFWQMTIWIDVILFGPFYAFASYAFIRGREWIRVPAFVWAGMMMSNVLILLMEERFGAWRAPNFAYVAALNLPWLLLPFAVIARLARAHPFTRTAAT
jgi:hypothetical protein